MASIHFSLHQMRCLLTLVLYFNEYHTELITALLIMIFIGRVHHMVAMRCRFFSASFLSNVLWFGKNKFFVSFISTFYEIWVIFGFVREYNSNKNETKMPQNM